MLIGVPLVSPLAVDASKKRIERFECALYVSVVCLHDASKKRIESRASAFPWAHLSHYDASKKRIESFPDENRNSGMEK